MVGNQFRARGTATVTMPCHAVPCSEKVACRLSRCLLSIGEQEGWLTGERPAMWWAKKSGGAAIRPNDEITDRGSVCSSADKRCSAHLIQGKVREYLTREIHTVETVEYSTVQCSTTSLISFLPRPKHKSARKICFPFLFLSFLRHWSLGKRIEGVEKGTFRF